MISPLLNQLATQYENEANTEDQNEKIAAVLNRSMLSPMFRGDLQQLEQRPNACPGALKLRHKVATASSAIFSSSESSSNSSGKVVTEKRVGKIKL